MRIFVHMKARLNITIDKEILERIKYYADKQNSSVSEIVESYFKEVIKPVKKENIISLVEQIPPPDFDVNTDLKDLYYREKARKHGF